MKRKFITPLLATLFLASISASGQEVLDGESLTVVSTKGSKLEIAQAFKETESEHFNDPKAPRFLLYDQKRQVAFGIGGNVRLRTAYDFDGSPASIGGFVPYSIPIPGNNIDRNKFAMEANHSSLFFKLLGNNSKLGQYQVYISGNFSGANNAFILQDAYIKVSGFTVGRTWSTFNDLAAIPPTVDWQGPNGAAEMRTELIRYSRNFTDKFSFGIAAELSQSTGKYGEPIKDLEMNQRIPDIPMYLQYAFGANNGSHVRVAGVIRNMNYRNEVKNKTEYATGYGVQLSTKLNITPMFTLYGQMTYGDGIAQYINDLSGNGLSLVSTDIPGSNEEFTGKMKAPEAMGWFVQGQVNFSKNLYATVGYSQARILSKQDKMDLADTSYRYGQYAVGNLFYNLSSDLQLGIEYLYGNRVNFNGEKGHANRIEALVQFSF